MGVVLVSLAFHQHGPKGIKSKGVRLLPHSASVLRMCVAWDFTPAVCSFPASSSDADAGLTHEAPAAGSASGQEPHDLVSPALHSTRQHTAVAAAGSVEQAESSRAEQQSSTDGQVMSLSNQDIPGTAWL